MQHIDNPFANYGHIVYGDRFIGRQDYLKEIESRVIRPPGGNLAIIGQRRVGKSSLAYQAVMGRRNELLQQRTLPVRVSVTEDTSQQFFCELVGICFRKLEDLGWANRPVREASNEIRDRDIERFNFGVLKDFFDEICTADIRIILVIDEFDKTVRFFDRDKSFFDRLRELSYRGQTTLLTISRDPITKIEQKANITSTLAGVFHDQYLGMFAEQEISDHFERLMTVGVTLTAEDRQRIMTICGGHPFLLDKVAFELVELFRHDTQIRVSEALRRSEHLFLREFNCIIEHLRDRKLLEQLTHVLFASPTTIKPDVLDEITRYGLIRPTGSGYNAFSASFQERLRQEQPVMIEELTPAERRILTCLKSESQNKEIARDLNLSVDTVKTHITNILRKLQAKTRHEAVRIARDREIID